MSDLLLLVPAYATMIETQVFHLGGIGFARIGYPRIGGAGERAKEGVRRAGALSIHQLSNRVIDLCHVTAP
jgi:hypothetical protein